MAEVKRYILILEQDPPTILTVCLWDGETPYTPPDGCRIELQTDLYQQVAGATFVDGAWRAAPLQEDLA
jgi:hypothetical protein